MRLLPRRLLPRRVYPPLIQIMQSQALIALEIADVVRREGVPRQIGETFIGGAQYAAHGVLLFLALAAPLKKILQQRTAFGLQHPALHAGLMVQLGVGKQIDDASRRTGLRIVRTKYDFFQARMQHRASAHGAGFERDVELAIGQAVIAQPGRRSAQGNHLGVGGGVVRAHRMIAAGGNHFTVAHHHRTHRHFACRPGLECLCRCEAHEY